MATSDPPDGDASPNGDGTVTPGDEALPGADGSADADAGADAMDAAIDAGPFDLEERPACPRPDPGPAPCTGVAIGAKPCVPEVLFDAPVAEHVFGIDADRRHAFWLAQLVDVDADVSPYNGDAPATLRRVDRATHEVVELARDQKRGTIVLAHGAHVFWAAEEPASTGKFVIRMLRKDAPACSPASCPTPVTIATNLPRVRHLGALGTGVILAVSGDGTFRRVITSGPSTAQIGQSTTFPGFAVGDGVAYLSGGQQPGIERYDVSGMQLADLGVLPDASLGADYLLTTCTNVFARSNDNQIRWLAADASAGTFTRFTTLANPFQIYSAASDARFLYYGAANAQGFRRVDTTIPDAGAIEIAKGSVWGIAVTDDAIIYAEHGEIGGKTPNDIGTVYSLPK